MESDHHNTRVVINPRRSDYPEVSPVASSSLTEQFTLAVVSGEDVLAMAVLARNEQNPAAWKFKLDPSLPNEATALQALAKAVRVWAFDQGAKSVRLANTMEETDPRCAALLAAGFSEVSRLRTFQTSFTKEKTIFEPLMKKLEARGKIPAGVEVLPLDALPMNAVKELIRREVIHSRGRVYSLEPQGAYSPELSFGIRLKQRIVAAILVGEAEGDLPEIKWAAVDGDLRGDWLFVMTQYELRKRLLSYNGGKAVFRTNPDLDRGMLHYAQNHNSVDLGSVVQFTATQAC